MRPTAQGFALFQICAFALVGVHAAEVLTPAVSPWSRVVTVGASATAGVKDPNSTTETNAHFYRLSRYLDAALVTPHEPVQNFGSSFLFFAPSKLAKAQVDRALKYDPTLVVGIDFLFWFCYGDASSEDARLERFRNGLKLLEPLTCPLILGDIPDASAATNKLLRPQQVPEPRTISACNDLLKSWTAKRPHTVVVGLANFMESARDHRAISIRGRQWATEHLLQQDRLHPTARGAALLAIAILNQACLDHVLNAEKGIRWDVEDVLQRGLHLALATNNVAVRR